MTIKGLETYMSRVHMSTYTDTYFKLMSMRIYHLAQTYLSTTSLAIILDQCLD